jgi:hypothetical protein
MIAAMLFILVGAFGTAIFLAATGASWATIALGYVAGGGSGLLIGGMLVLFLRRVGTPRKRWGKLRRQSCAAPGDDLLG